MTTLEFVMPNEMPFEFEKTTVPLVAVWVPAAAAIPPPAPGLTDAVITDPFRPNETPLPFENVMADRFCEVVPALTLMFVRLVAIEAVRVDAFRPKETPFEFENVNAEARLLVVPAERLMLAWVEATVTEAVTTDEFDIPNETLFEFEKTTVPLVAVWVPAAAAIPPPAPGLTDAVITDPLRPNETPLPFENVMADRFCEVVPALTLMFVRLVAIEAVRVDAFRPKETPFEFENVNAEARLLVVPAERLMLAWVEATVTEAVTTDEFDIPNETLFEFEKTTVPLVAVWVPAAAARLLALAVMVPAFNPKLTSLLFENVNAEARFDVVPALRLMLAWVDATVTDAVTTELLDIPNVTLFEFENTTVPDVAVCVPAARAPRPDPAAADAVIVEPFKPNETLFEFEKTTTDRFCDVVPALTLMLVSDVATDAVIVEAFRPNEMPFEFENVNAEARFEVVPADRLMLA